MTDTETAVCDDIKRRQQFGIHKYGRTVAQNPLTLRQWLQHAYEECLDQAVYLKRAMQEMDEQQNKTFYELRKIHEEWVEQDAQDNNGDNT